MASDWDPTSIQEELDLEMMGVRTDGGEVVGKTHEQVSKEIAVKTAPFAMKRIAWLACYSENEGIALKAADLILNRVFGKVTDIPLMTGSEQDLLREMVDSAYGHNTGPKDE